MDCERVNCFTCKSAFKTEKQIFGNFHQRSVIYETWCETCRKGGETEKMKNSENKERSQKENYKKRDREQEEKEGPMYRYIGESSRSTYERGSEHLADLKHRRTRSHLLRHCVEGRGS